MPCPRSSIYLYTVSKTRLFMWLSQVLASCHLTIHTKVLYKQISTYFLHRHRCSVWFIQQEAKNLFSKCLDCTNVVDWTQITSSYLLSFRLHSARVAANLPSLWLCQCHWPWLHWTWQCSFWHWWILHHSRQHDTHCIPKWKSLSGAASGLWNTVSPCRHCVAHSTS